MYLLKKAIFFLLLISFFSINHVVFAEEANNEYLVKTNHIGELITEYPISIEDELSPHSIYKIILKEPSNEVLSQLKNDSRVISFSPNNTIEVPPVVEQPHSLFSTFSLDSEWGFKSMNFPQTIHSITTVDIAILDTGVDTDHPLLKDSIKDGYDALFDRSIEDEHGHGTHVAGIIAKNTPHLRIIPIKTLNKNGNGDLYAFIRGLYYAIDHRADVINMSFGITSDNEMVREAVNEAISNDISIIAASGNNGSAHLLYPANYEDVISVGAYDQNEVKAQFSQYGDHLDFVAPGVDIWSSWLGGEYKLESGTSMATPFISKTVALIKSINPNLSATEIQEILITSASPLKGETVQTIGHGKVNVDMALKLAEEKGNSYEYFPSKYNVPPAKDWKIELSLPIDINKFDASLIRVVDVEGKEVEASVQLDVHDPSVINVLPPPNGYAPGKEYELIIEKDLVSKSGKTLPQGVAMKFTVK